MVSVAFGRRQGAFVLVREEETWRGFCGTVERNSVIVTIG